MIAPKTFANIDDLAADLRQTLENKKYVLLYAYNGIGKTRLSMAFKDIGKNGDERDTLYFNAFTEDLFSWDNDLDNDTERVLRMNRYSRFFSGLEVLEMENRIRPFLQRYADYDFSIDDTSAGTTAVSGTGLITMATFQRGGIDVTSLIDGILTIYSFIHDSILSK